MMRNISLIVWFLFCLIVVLLSCPRELSISGAGEPETPDAVAPHHALLFTPTLAEYLFVTRRPESVLSGYLANGIVVRNGILKKVYPQLNTPAVINSNYPGGTSLETLFSLNPDVVFEWAFRCNLLKQYGIPVICIDPQRDEERGMIANTHAYAQGMAMPERARHLISRYQQQMALLLQQLKPPRPGKRVLFLSVSNSGRLSASASPSRSALVSMAGGIDLCNNTAGNGLIDAEEVIRMDPDFIFLESYSHDELTPEAFMHSAIWRTLTAVKNRHVYMIPRGAGQWFYGIAETPLFARWISEILQPSLPPMLRQQITDTYQKELGYSLSTQDLDWLLAVEENRHAAGYPRFFSPTSRVKSNQGVK